MFLTEKGSFGLPTPPQMHNKDNYIISLGNFCRWLGEQAEALGVEVYPGFPAASVLYHEDGSVRGVATGDMGIGKDGEKTDGYMPGMDLLAKHRWPISSPKPSPMATGSLVSSKPPRRLWWSWS